MNIGFEIIRQEAAERAMARYRAQQAAATPSSRLVEIERELAELKRRTAADPGDYSLNRKYLALTYERQELQALVNPGEKQPRAGRRITREEAERKIRERSPLGGSRVNWSQDRDKVERR